MTISARRAVHLIARRELNARVKTRSFVVGTAVILVVMAGYLILQATLFGGQNTGRIGLTGQATALAGQLTTAAAQVGRDVRTSTVANLAQGRDEVRSGDLDILLSGSATDLRVVVKSDLDPQLRAVLNGISRQQVLDAKLAEAGLDPAGVMREVDATAVTVDTLDPDPGRAQRLAIGLVTVFLLFFGIQTYGSSVAQGVVEEKSSHVVEILLATVRPGPLMLGKVLGLGLAGLAQLVIVAGFGLSMAIATGTLTLTAVALTTLGWGIVWYVLGFFLYATIFAAAGALVSRQEDAASVITPVTSVLTLGFLAGFNFLIQNPDGSTARTLSLIPFFSPIVMPGRMASGAARSWEVELALIATLVTAALFTALAARIYRNAVLHTGTRLSLTKALRG